MPLSPQIHPGAALPRMPRLAPRHARPPHHHCGRGAPLAGRRRPGWTRPRSLPTSSTPSGPLDAFGDGHGGEVVETVDAEDPQRAASSSRLAAAVAAGVERLLILCRAELAAELPARPSRKRPAASPVLPPPPSVSPPCTDDQAGGGLADLLGGTEHADDGKAATMPSVDSEGTVAVATTEGDLSPRSDLEYP